MAIEIFSIPAMSDEPKRVFLGGHCMVLWKKMQIDPETLKKTKCLKNWHQRRTVKEISGFSLSI